MNIIQNILTKNPCYTTGKKITVKGLMLHSVGCPQSRASVFIESWNKEDYDNACVHALIDGNDGTVYQTLPWNHRGWHCGKGSKGSGNDSYIGVEMCEPVCIKYTSGSKFTCSDTETAKAVAKRTYEAAVELFAYLCKKYNLNPLAEGVILSHAEGYARGIASNHGDPQHLWNQLGMGYTMDTFRAAVNIELQSVSTDETIWNFLKSKGLNDFAIAGIMGNLYAESALKSNNLQNCFETKLGMNDAEYTAAVDNGSYTNFVNDSAGYGLAQWTYWSRKQSLLDFVHSRNKSIGDLETQLEFMWKELSGYVNIMKTLNSATSILEASNVILMKYEKPADQSETVQKKRATYGQTYYDKFAITSSIGDNISFPDCPFMVKVIDNLNYYSEPSQNGKVKGQTGKGTFTIVEVNGDWGKLKSGAGWICLGKFDESLILI